MTGIRLTTLMTVLVLLALPAFSREVRRLTTDWQFKKKDGNWETVSLPHTAHIEPYVLAKPMWMGSCYYQKEIDYEPAWEGKKVSVAFEGAMLVAKVSLNGNLLIEHFDGYMGFEVDVTPHLKKGKNLLEVVLDNNWRGDVPLGKPYKQLDFAWFSGLYRNVFLKVTEPLYITNPLVANKPASGGVFVTYPRIDNGTADVAVETHLQNDSSSSQSFVVKQELVRDGEVVASNTSGKQTVEAGKDIAISQTVTVKSPALWSPQEPNLYELKTAVVCDGKVVDDHSCRIGIRRVHLSAKGFVVNGKRMYLRGTNRHQEFPYVGYAASDEMQYRDACRIKQAGFDIIRLSHYPQAPAFYRACDELGLMLIDCVTGWQYFNDKGAFGPRCLQQAREMIRRDRNHPSVVMWETSINETGMPGGYLKTMHDIVDQEYPGDQSYSVSWKNGPHDVFGPARQHGKPPKRWDSWQQGDKALFTAEYGDWEYVGGRSENFNQHEATNLKGKEASTRQLRKDGETRLLQQVYNYMESHNQNMRGMSIIGDANWLAIDYNRGYAPDHCASGVLDLMRLPKFAFYFYQSQRSATERQGPMVFAATYWNEKSHAIVRVFSNCEEVAACLNGKEVARQKPDKGEHSTHLNSPVFSLDFKEFTPGEIRFDGYIKGQKVASHTVKTPEKAMALKLFTRTCGKPLQANMADAVFVYAAVVDANGTVVPDASTRLSFKVTGAQVLGPNEVAAEAGINGILVGKTDKTAVNIEVSASGLKSDTLSLEVQK